MRTKPIAVFMAFGTKGDVYPIAAIAAAFASDQKQYEVAFLTHSAHQSLKGHLGAKGIAYFPISSPPVLSSHQDNDTEGPEDISFSLQKKEITRKHRQECISAVEGILGEDPVISGDLIFINFFALEGWSLAELFHVRCVVAAPYVVPYSAPSSFERQFRNELPLLYKYLRESRAGEIGWADIIHWMWPLFTGDWGKWRSLDLKLSFLPFTDPITDLPTWHDRPSSPLLLYGFSQEIVECPGYWPSAVRVFIRVLENVLNISNHRFILFSAGYGPLDAAIETIAYSSSSASEQMESSEIQTSLFDGRLFCFSGEMPYSLLFPKCAAVIHHGGSGTTSAALRAGVPQIICPFIMDQFYWAERMFWLGVASEPLSSSCVLPDKDDENCILRAANVLLQAIDNALSPRIKICAREVADRISTEDGVSTALRIIKQEIIGDASTCVPPN